MPRRIIVLSALLGLAIGVALMLLLRPVAAPDEAKVRSIVAEMITAHDAETPAPVVAAAMPAAPAAPMMMNTPPMDVATLGPMIDSYLMSNPKILQRMSDALDVETRTSQAVANKEAISKYKDQIFNDPDKIVVGNPNGDVTLVEMFDYNCSFCRGALPDLAALIAEDPNLKVVLKEFPILSQQSVDAARVGVLVSQQPVDYWSFHQKLFTSRGQVTVDTALDAAKDLGLNPVTLQMDMQAQKVTDIIQKSYDIAKALNVTGTPTYIIGDELIPGAVPIEQLRTRIANMRACGKTVCDTAG